MFKGTLKNMIEQLKTNALFKLNVVLIMFSSIFFCVCKSTEPTVPEEIDINIVVQKCKIYNNENSGLPDNSIKALAVDNQNNLWVGMFHNGVIRFDGGSCTMYNTQNSDLPSDEIRSLAVDCNNNVWIGTDNGLAKYDDHNWMIYDTTNSPLPYHVISSLAVDNDNILWIGCGHATAGGVLSFDGSNWKLYIPENSLLPCSIIQVIHVDEKNNKWIGTGIGVGASQGGGLVKIDNNGNWSVYTKQNSELLYNSVDALTTDLEGNLWIGYKAWLYLEYGYYHGGLQKFNGQNWTDYSPHPNGVYNPEAIVSNRVSEIVCDKYGYLWITTETEWKYPYNLSLFKNGVWNNLSDIAQDFPINPFIRDIKIDKNNDVWLATKLGVISINYSPK